MRTLALAAAAAFAAVLPAALPATAASTTTVSMVDNAFKPTSTTVAVGDTVTWRNDGNAPHEVSSAAFSSGNVDKGRAYSWKATKAGTFAYVCRYHESAGMKATLVVRAASSGAAPVTGHPNTGGGDDVALGLLLVGVTAVAGLSLRYGWRTR